MKYIINEKIVFDPDVATLSPDGIKDEEIQISNPANRLLVLLISHQGEAVSREVIFARVWDNFGMKSSNNNLNHCISKLRKIFRTFGTDEEVITTVPRFGFMLRQQIAVQKVPDECPIHSPLADGIYQAAVSSGQMLTPPVMDQKETTTPLWLPWRKIRLPHAFWLCLAGIALVFITYLLSSPGLAGQKNIYIETVSNCKILLAKKGLTNRKEAGLIAEIVKYSRQINLTCKNNEYLLVTQDDTPVRGPDKLSRYYFMRCRAVQENQTEFCHSLP